MKNLKLLLFLSITAGLALSSCSKREVYLRYPSASPPKPFSEYVYFFYVVIDSNSTHTFKVPDLSQAIIDSGTMQVYFKTSLVLPDNDYSPLPEYTFPDRNAVIVNLISFQPGQVVVGDPGPTTPSMDYYVYLSSSR
jgi:hypothetical protein